MPRFEEIEEGQALPELRKTPTLQTLVKYSAGSGDFNPLHHDYDFPQSKQIGSIIVHGRFKYASLGQLVSDWLGHAGRIERISCQYRGMDLPNATFVCKGVIKKKSDENGKRTVEIDVWTENAEGKKTTPGSVTVAFR
ncbi:MAG TPA: MaoC/PaaZ C-terminal domain-containing protein [Candidatus Limnocylindrales bacterium]|nr:MaoC/PaaZ C-terminal domain-containing protein [Candidatus Limnocylindrales bacterium]